MCIQPYATEKQLKRVKRGRRLTNKQPLIEYDYLFPFISTCNLLEEWSDGNCVTAGSIIYKTEVIRRYFKKYHLFHFVKTRHFVAK